MPLEPRGDPSGHAAQRGKSADPAREAFWGDRDQGVGQEHSLTVQGGVLLVGLTAALLLQSCNRSRFPDGPPCSFQSTDLPADWKRFELPFGVFYGPAYLGEAREIPTFEGIEFEFSTPGLRLIADQTSSINIGEDVLCSESTEDHQQVVWHRFESNRARVFGHHYLAYLWDRPIGQTSSFSLWVHVEDDRLIGDAERIARSVSPRKPRGEGG